MKNNLKNLCFMSVLASLYFVLTIAFSPMSYGPIQIRISDILQPFILFGWQYNIAIAVGTFLANLGSPFGIIDFGMMPFVSLIAGYCGYVASRYFLKFKFNQYIGMFVFAHFIAMGVGVVLYIGAGVPYQLGYLSVLVSGLISNFIGVPIVNKLVSTLKKRGFNI